MMIGKVTNLSIIKFIYGFKYTSLNFSKLLELAVKDIYAQYYNN